MKLCTSLASLVFVAAVTCTYSAENPPTAQLTDTTDSIASSAASGEAAGVDKYRDWKHSSSIWLLTTPEGANLPASAQVEQFPALVRLHREYFDFRQARPQGEDLRFSTVAGESLAYQIEEWDVERGVASVWVRIPLISGNSRQEIKVYWGNSAARSESDGAAVFNASNGYVGVWHMNEPLRDELGLVTTADKGTSSIPGLVGSARHFAEGQGISGGEMISHLPHGGEAHSTELWFRPERPNATLIAWGNEEAQGKVVMQYRSPPHLQMDCYFSDGNVTGLTPAPLGKWTHVVHAYQPGGAKLYVDGVLDSSEKQRGAPLNIRRPARISLGGWYDHYDFVGDLDEVRISSIARSADWVKLQYENQKPHQSLVGLCVQPGSYFSVSPITVRMSEGQRETVTVQAGGAQKIVWTIKHNGQDSVVATNRLSYDFHAGRVLGLQTVTLNVQAIYANEVKSQDITITIDDDVPEPIFDLSGPAAWDGRKPIQIEPVIANREAMQLAGVGDMNVRWAIDGVAVIKQTESGKLLLKRAQGDGVLRVTAIMDNGGAEVARSLDIHVQQPRPSKDAWMARPIADHDQPEDNQFIPRDTSGMGGLQYGSLVYAGTLVDSADSVFLRVFADDQLYATETATVQADRKYKLTAKLGLGLVKYRTEFGAKTGEREVVLHTAKNIICGDAFLIIGQSNAVATDFGQHDPPPPSEWIRTFGTTSGDPAAAGARRWANAEARTMNGEGEIGYWGMELGQRLVASEGIPICILNGAVGGTRIDQHQRHDANPADLNTIYGRLLWRAQQAKLTHGIRAVLWHQGENDQGADGPTGRYGYETYRQFFVDLAASWKEDYPNIQYYYVFQIWPKACAMGINGSDNRLREVQRTLPKLFSHLSVIATVGVKPPGGCHFPAEGYAEFAKLLHPMMRYHLYHRFVDPFNTPNLQRAYFSSKNHDEVTLEFDSQMNWSDQLVSQFQLDGEANQVVGGAENGSSIILRLKGPTKSKTVSYLDGDQWSPDNLLYGRHGLAALTFCDVPIEEE